MAADIHGTNFTSDPRDRRNSVISFTSSIPFFWTSTYLYLPFSFQLLCESWNGESCILDCVVLRGGLQRYIKYIFFPRLLEYIRTHTNMRCRLPVKNRFSYSYRSDSTRPVFKINYGRTIFTKSCCCCCFFSSPKHPGDKNNGALILRQTLFLSMIFFSFLS